MQKKLTFYPLDVQYKELDGKAVVFIYGRSTSGEQVVVLDDSLEPYFYAVLKEGSDADAFIDKVKKVKVDGKSDCFVSDARLVKKKLLGRQVTAAKVFCNLPKSVPVVRDEVKGWKQIDDCYEYDIPFTRRYLIDKQLTPLETCIAEGDFVDFHARAPVFKAVSVKQHNSESLEKPHILAFDIETYNPSGKVMNPEKNPIVMLSFYGSNFKKVLTWKRFKTGLDYVEFVDGEEQLLERFKEIIEKEKPDVLCGYYSDGFDFPYIRARCDHYKLKLDIGLDFSEVSFRKGMNSSAAITGIVHVDVLSFVRRVVSRNLDTYIYTLDAVAEELLGEKKIKVDMERFFDVWDNHHEKLGEYVEYNLHDSYLTYSLCKMLWPNMEELVRIVGVPLFDCVRMGFSQLVEWFILKQTPDFNEIALNNPHHDDIEARRRQTYTGAFVFEPKPGLYSDIVVFDFRSLYPSIVVSHNIDLATLNCDCCSDKEKAPTEKGEYWFCKKKKGFLPSLLEDLISRRARIKDMIKKDKNVLLSARSEALKVLANSFYGYFGFFGARYYSIECARSITAYGRYYINKVVDEAKKEGFKVLYGDSVTGDRFVTLLNKDGFIEIKNIEHLFLDNSAAKQKIGEKELIELKDYKALTVNLKTKKVGWEKVNKIIRHKTDKKIFRVSQKYGETRVTEDHSIICSDGKNFIESRPQDIRNKHLTKIVKIPAVKTIKEIDIYEILKDYSYKVGYKGRVKEARAKADQNFVWFGWTNRKITIKVKRFIKVGSEEFNALCRLLGYYIAEGSSSTPETTLSRLCASISTSNENALKELQKDYNLLFLNAKVSIIDSQKGERTLNYSGKTIRYNDNTKKLQMMNHLSAVFFKSFCGQKSTGKKLPYFIYHVDDKYKRILLDKMIEGDGSKVVDKRYSENYKKSFFKYTTNSLELISGVSLLLNQLKQNHSIAYRPSKKVYMLTTSTKSNKLFKTKIIEEKYEGYVYDLEVENSHVFVDACGQILLHNTDSIFLSLDDKKKKDADEFLEKVNEDLPGVMELDFEGFYPSGIFVSAKMGSLGAKKRYALLDQNDNLKITGFETVRRNVSNIAKNAQEKVLKIILKEHDKEKALRYVRGIIDDIRDKKVKNEELIIHTQLQKDIEDYANFGPHVAVAERMRKAGMSVGSGAVIEYIVSAGSGIIRDRAKFPSEVKEGDYDPAYYIDHQIIPCVEKLFEVLGYTKDDLVSSKTQKKLGSFFNKD